MSLIHTARQLAPQVIRVLEQVPIDFGGGCSVAKAMVLASLIARRRLARSIDIGVYRGRSFFPQAIAHREATGGRVLGIDPYSSRHAIEHDNAELASAIEEFAVTTDFDALLARLHELRDDFRLLESSEVIRLPSREAADLAARQGPFGLIHVDGNHDRSAVVDDVERYLPLLDRHDGFLVLDDISWTSVKPATVIAGDRLHLLYAQVDTHDDYAVFWNGRSPREAARLRHDIAETAALFRAHR